MSDVAVPELQPTGPIVHEVLIVLKLQTRHQGHFALATVHDLLVLHPFLEVRKIGRLLLFVLPRRIKDQSILVHSPQGSPDAADEHTAPLILLLFPHHLEGLLLFQLLLEDPGHFFEGILAVGFGVVLGFGSPNSAGVLGEVLLKLLDLVFFLFVVVGVDAEPDKFCPLDVVQHGTEFFDGDSFLLLLVGEFVLDGVAIVGQVRDVLDEVFSPEVFVVVVVLDLLVVVVPFLPPLRPQLIQTHPRLSVSLNAISEEFLDALLRFDLAVPKP